MRIIQKTLSRTLLLALMYLLLFGNSYAAARVQPFILASEQSGDLASVVAEVQKKLESAGFTVVGSYSPYANAEVLAFTSDELKANSLKSKRGGYGAVMRASVTTENGKNDVVYTNPVYWSNAYRLASSNDNTLSQLKTALGFIKEFGSGDKELTAEDMRDYHYTFMMEYFDDPSDLKEFKSHEQAVNTVEQNLKAKKAGTSLVYKLDLGKDTKGKQMTLFGVGLGGTGADDCSSDKYIMSRIDKSHPRHTAHLPYELLVYGDEAEALYGRFRIAISWPYLPMLQSDTGATFFSIMCAPGAIKDALEAVAGG